MKVKIGIIVGVAAVILTILVVALFNISNNNSKEKTYSFNDARRATNRYAHFLIDGEKNDQSNIDEIDKNSKTYLERVLQDDTEKSIRQDFLKTAKELGDDMLLKISHLVSDDTFSNIDQFIDKAGDVAAETNMLAGYYNTDYSIEKFIKNYNEDDEKAFKFLKEKYKDLAMYYTLSIEGASGLEDEDASEDEDDDNDEEADKEDDESISNRDLLSKTELIIADFYDCNMAYSEALVDAMDTYEAASCIDKENKVDEECSKKINTSEEGKWIKESLKEDLSRIKTIVDKAVPDLAYNVQWLAVNFKNQKR